MRLPAMSVCGFASLPIPPCHAVIFSSRRSAAHDAAHAAAVDAMVELAARKPGFPGFQSARDGGGFGIKVSSRIDGAAISVGLHQPEHAAVRVHGREHGCQHYELRVAKVGRAYGTKTTS